MDDLTAPLGLAPAKQPKSRLKRLRLAAGALAAGAAVIVGWALLIHDPRGGETVAVAPVGKPAVSDGTATDKTGSIRQTAGPGAPQSADDDGSSLVEITPAGGLTELGNGVVIRDPSAPEPILLAAAH